MSGIAICEQLESYAAHNGTVAVTRDRRALRDEVRTALALGCQQIVIDCAGWLELDLPLLSMLVQCARDCAACGATWEIANLGKNIRADIEALRLDGRLGLTH